MKYSYVISFHTKEKKNFMVIDKISIRDGVGFHIMLERQERCHVIKFIVYISTDYGDNRNKKHQSSSLSFCYVP